MACNAGAQPFCQLCGAPGVRFQANDYEFFASNAACQVAVAYGGAKQCGHVPQNFIPCLVSMGVVDALEMVDIHQ